MEGTRVRRRLVQSTLFPHREGSVKEAENCDGDEFEESNYNKEEEEEEEWCSNAKKRKGKANSKPKTKTTPPQSRASSRKATANGKETSGKQADDVNSPAIVKSDFFLKASERSQQKRQQKEPILIDSPDKNEETSSPSNSAAKDMSTPRKLKRRANPTPKKERMNSTPKKRMTNGLKESILTPDKQPPQTIPNLRLEAKLTAEENSRIFFGRQIHPFFTSRKVGKMCQEPIDMESTWFSLERKEKGNTFSPIHVFENVEDNEATVDWGHWVFSERSSVSTSGSLGCGCLPVYEGSVNSLHFDTFLSASSFIRTLSYQNKTTLDQCSQIEKDSKVILKDTEGILAAPVELTWDHGPEEIDSFTGYSSGVNSDAEFQERLLQERIMSHYHSCRSQPENCLWTDKYQPENSLQVCGNSEEVKFLSEWLHLWHTRGSLTTRRGTADDKSTMQNANHDCYQSDCNSDSVDDEENLKNVLLVTGPVGSGKSAAIYACAKEKGFQVIEINASDWRNGALIKQKFGEAVESHWHQCKAENPTNSDYRPLSKSLSAFITETQCSDDEVIEMVPFSQNADSHDTGARPERSVCWENRNAIYQNEIKTLILFEDVDATLCEDHGFISTIQQLAETAKRPMILTSNSNNPVLPKSLDRLELNFAVPSLKELFGLVHVVCASEKAVIHPLLVERFIDYCQGDIRKTITHLQFWCQGQSPRQGNEMQTTYSPLLFDLDAGHQILPKIIPWGYPSRLSELVEEEIVKSLILMEENQSLVEIVVQEDKMNDNKTEITYVKDGEADTIEAKKEAMLRLHSSTQDDGECAQFGTNWMFSDSSHSPIAFTRQNSRKKIDAVLSDSEGECFGERIPIVSEEIIDSFNGDALKMKSSSTNHCSPTESCCHPTEQIDCFEVDKLEESCCQLSAGVDISLIDNTHKSLDIYHEPELSFVPETQIMNEGELFSTTVSYGHFANAVEAESVIQDSLQNLDPVRVDKFHQSLHMLPNEGELFTTTVSYGHFTNAEDAKSLIQDLLPHLDPVSGDKFGHSLRILPIDQEILGNKSDTNTVLGYQEEVGDSLSKHEEDAPRGYQVMDECSRVDFIRRLKSFTNPEPDRVIDSLQETWKNLRGCHEDFKQYVTFEEKNACQALNLAHGMSNLISEADLLLRDCQALLCDFLEPSKIPCEKSHSYSSYDDQMQMSSVLALHGTCYYAKETAALGSIMGSISMVDLASEMLGSSVSTMALGKLASHCERKIGRLKMKPPQSCNLLRSKMDSSLYNLLKSVVPSKSYLAAKGEAFHEYLSTLSQISRLEDCRLSECVDKRKQRRARVARHYLSSGSLALSAEEISLMGKLNSYLKASSHPKDEIFR
ncbi:P-loop containing nucleoside triphosphate hydrolase superfamily protein [Forsythia ovata]|uniref:P-loop containing nucleoside triphosphate hydrolase superfamily protein n=1 Tax=Forsythia ovata TaxID=205694 RepID=A0ABD1PUY5_9LAMI